jgi:CRP-like cAMP-binding protein
MTSIETHTDTASSSLTEKFLCFLNNLHPLREQTKELIIRHSYFVERKKGAFLFKPGMDHRSLYFLVKGVVRGYRKYKGEEITTWLNEENEMITSISNIGLEQECEEYIQAITDIQLIGISAETVESLFSNCPEIPVITRLLLEDNYRGAEERAFISRIPSADEKYLRYIKKQPGLINRIPLKYSASYLGMRLETLCRIRNKRLVTC